MIAAATDPTLKEIIRSGRPLMVIKQDECVFTNRPMILATTLGSCVAAAFMHRSTRNCALFHAFWPTAGDRPEWNASPCRFADTAVQGVADRYKALGIPFCEVEVDLAGGSHASKGKLEKFNIGKKNVDAALGALKSLGFAIRETHVLGSASRTLYLDTVSCQTWIRASAHEDAVPMSREGVIDVPGVQSCHLDLID